jgi:hypothetical protein
LGESEFPKACLLLTVLGTIISSGISNSKALSFSFYYSSNFFGKLSMEFKNKEGQNGLLFEI